MPYTDSTFEQDFPNISGYLDDASITHLIESQTTNELLAIESALNEIESAMILLRQTAEISSMLAIHNAINTIWDNSHDLIDD